LIIKQPGGGPESFPPVPIVELVVLLVVCPPVPVPSPHLAESGYVLQSLSPLPITHPAA
jgi:hypothetical protein